MELHGCIQSTRYGEKETDVVDVLGETESNTKRSGKGQRCSLNVIFGD